MRQSFEGVQSSDNAEAGYTLLELLVVLGILGLIAVIAVPAVMNQMSGARSKTASIQLRNLGGILDLYKLENGSYPSDEAGLSALVERPVNATSWSGPYLKDPASLIDPWGNPYHYKVEGSSYVLMSFGSDGKEGGEDDAADIKLGAS